MSPLKLAFQLSFALPFAAAQAPSSPQLQATLARLDLASAHFTSAEAHVHRDSYSSLLKDIDDRQDGTIYFQRGKDNTTQMGIKTEGRGARTVEYKHGTVRDFNPATRCYDTVTRPGIDTYLTLGFGGTGKDLDQRWKVTDLGPDTINGTKVEKLDLVPRDAAVQANITKVSLWLDLDRDVSLKQIFFSPSGDTNTAVYTDIRHNKSINLKPYAIPGGPCGK